MDKNQVLEKLQIIFSNIMDLEGKAISFETTAEDIEEWDSLSHVQLVLSIEKEFGIKFTSREILSWKNVGEMIDSIVSKKN